MIKPSAKQLKPVLTTLEPDQFMRLMRLIMNLRTEEAYKAPLDAGQQLTAYLYEWLVHLGFLSDDKIRWLMTCVGFQGLQPLSEWLEKHYDDWPCTPPTPVFTLAVTDQQYALWPGVNRWADLQNEEFVSRLEMPGCTHIVADLFAIFHRKQLWLKRLQGGKYAGHRHYAGGDVGVDDVKLGNGPEAGKTTDSR